MACPCCVQQSCGCLGATCNLNVQYNGTLRVFAFVGYQGQPPTWGMTSTEHADGLPDIRQGLMSGLSVSAPNQNIRAFQQRAIAVGSCLADPPQNSQPFTINSFACPDQQVLSGTSYNGKPVDVAIWFGEAVGVDEYYLYTVVSSDGTPCPLPAGASKANLTLEYLGSVRGKMSYENSFHSSPISGSSAKCSGTCGDQVDLWKTNLTVFANSGIGILRSVSDPDDCVLWTTPAPYGAWVYDSTFPNACTAQGLKDSAFPRRDGLSSPYPEGSRVYYVGANGNLAVASPHGHKPDIFRAGEFLACYDVGATPPAGNNVSCNTGTVRPYFSYTDLDFICGMWALHPTPTVSLVCAP
jgi:hypothetical protein